MPIAVNPDTGETVYLDDSGQWQKAQTAVNPETKEMLAFDGKQWAPVTPQNKEESKGVLGYVDDAVRSVASGMTFGFADELAAKMNEFTGLGGSYDENLKKEQKRDASIPTAIKLPGEIAGGVASSVLAAPAAGAASAATGLSKLPQWMRLAGIGGATGGLYGAGSAEQGERTEGAAKGALIGAPLGVAIPYALRGGVKVGQEVRNFIQPQRQAQADLGRAILRDADTPIDLAARAIAAKGERPGVATLADVGGENVRGIVERVAQTPGAGRTQVIPALTGRQRGQANRVAADLTGLTGTYKTATQAIDETMAQRAAAAKPLYEKAMAFDATTSQELQQTFINATESGWGKAIINSPAFKRTLQTEYGSDVDPRRVLMPVIDAWKKQADDLINEAIRSGNNNKARVIGEMRNRVVAAADAANPDYKTARAAWESPSKYLDAVEEGRNILGNKVSAEEMVTRLAGMTDAEKEAFRVGAVSALQGKMRGDPAKLGDMTKYIRSPEMRDKIAAIMPTPEAAQKWAKRLDFEIQSSELTNRALGNSATARRLAEMEDAKNIPLEIAKDAIQGSTFFGVASKFASRVGRVARDTARSKSDNALADILTKPQSIDDLVKFLQQAQKRGSPLSMMTQGAAVTGAQPIFNQ